MVLERIDQFVDSRLGCDDPTDFIPDETAGALHLGFGFFLLLRKYLSNLHGRGMCLASRSERPFRFIETWSFGLGIAEYSGDPALRLDGSGFSQRRLRSLHNFD